MTQKLIAAFFISILLGLWLFNVTVVVICATVILSAAGLLFAIQSIKHDNIIQKENTMTTKPAPERISDEQEADLAFAIAEKLIDLPVYQALELLTVTVPLLIKNAHRVDKDALIAAKARLSSEGWY